MKGEAKVTHPKAYCITLPCDTMLWTHTVFTQVLFRLRFVWLMAKSSNMSALSFAWSSTNPLPKPLQCFVRLLENILLARQRFLNDIQVSKSVSWRWWTFRVTKHQQNDRKCWKNLRTHPRKPSPIHEFTNIAGISYGVCQEILTENLNMCCIATKFVPWLLANDQKQQRINVYPELWERANKDQTFISKIIKRDESWIYGYDPETKQQSSLWKSSQSSRVKKAWQVQSSTKSTLIGFFRREWYCSPWICSS
jgi:hypothetical protein